MGVVAQKGITGMWKGCATGLLGIIPARFVYFSLSKLNTDLAPNALISSYLLSAAATVFHDCIATPLDGD